MASGKTTIGKILAHKLTLPFWDSDKVIEKRIGLNINAIFEMHGEKFFRDYEHQIVKEFSDEYEGIFSTGGGSVLHQDSKTIFLSQSNVIYLKTSIETQLQRLEDDTTRPLLKNTNISKKLTELASIRNPIYKTLSKFIIKTDEKKPCEIIYNILKKLPTNIKELHS